MNVRNVGKLFMVAGALLSIREFITVQNVMNIRNVGRLFRGVQNFQQHKKNPSGEKL